LLPSGTHTSGRQVRVLKNTHEQFTVSRRRKAPYHLVIEEQEDTLKMIRAVGGTGHYAEQVRMDKNNMGGYEDASTVEFRERDNIQLSELKALAAGEGIIVFEDRQVRSNSIHIPDEDKISKLKVRINRYVPLRRPDFNDLCKEVPAAERRRPVSQQNIRAILDVCLMTSPEAWNSKPGARIKDKTLSALATLATDLDNRHDFTCTPEERAALLFETATQVLEKTQGRYGCVSEVARVRISKKRVEQAHKNNNSIKTTTGNAETLPHTVEPSPASSPSFTPAQAGDDNIQDSYYENLAQHAFNDDFNHSPDFNRY
jgi:intracellular multiplication protein IcmO